MTNSSVTTQPAPSSRTSEKDRWSVLLEFLKVAIAISSAIIGASVVIYIDPNRRPVGVSKYVLIIELLLVLMTLIFSIRAIVLMSNIVLNADHLPTAEKEKIGGKVKRAATTSYVGILFFAMVLLVFVLLNMSFGIT